jgi:hypothetical protein
MTWENGDTVTGRDFYSGLLGEHHMMVRYGANLGKLLKNNRLNCA